MASNNTKYAALAALALLLIGGLVVADYLLMGQPPLPPASAAAKPASPPAPATTQSNESATVFVVPDVPATSLTPATPAAPPPPPVPAGPRLVIKKAVYGDPADGFAPANCKDVTAIVAKMVKDDSLLFTPDNDNMGGDPAYGVKKYLHITYTFDGIQKEISAGENEGLVLTPQNQ